MRTHGSFAGATLGPRQHLLHGLGLGGLDARGLHHRVDLLVGRDVEARGIAVEQRLEEAPCRGGIGLDGVVMTPPSF